MGWQRTVVVAGLMVTMGLAPLLGQPGRAQEATPGADCPVTTVEENAALGRGYWEEVYNGRQPERVDEYLAEDFVRHNLARPHANEPGFEDDIQRVVDNLEDFPDLVLTVDDVIADEDSVAVRMVWTGTLSDDIRTLNVPATGETATFTVVAFYGVECGKLAEQWIVFDYLSMLQQNGIITEAELTSIGTAGDEGAAAATPESGS